MCPLWAYNISVVLKVIIIYNIKLYPSFAALGYDNAMSLEKQFLFICLLKNR